MADHICPQCNRMVSFQARYCGHCGFDLLKTPAFIENTEALTSPNLNGAPISPEILVPRIGETMIEQGVIDDEGLKRALDYQEELLEKGESLLLGQAMLTLGLVTRETLDEIITLQILKLQHALSDINSNLQQLVEERTQELQRALERLTELNNLKSNFISNISHELRTPLTHLKGYLDILSEGDLGALNHRQLDAIKILKNSEERLEQLIEDLIQFSLASKGEMTITPHTVEIGTLLRSTILRVDHKIKEKEITLRMDVPNGLPDVRADRDKLGWVLLQLLDNAIKFTPQGGYVRVLAASNGEFVKVAVMDTGIGIPVERMEEIFEPFHQLDSSTTRRYSGTGLGLAMARQIIEAHGSVIEVESIENKGSRFQFNLPISKNRDELTTN